MPELEDVKVTEENLEDGKGAEEEKDDFDFVDDGKTPEDPKEENDDDLDLDPDQDEDPETAKKIQKYSKKLMEKALIPIRAEAEKSRVRSEWAEMKAEYPELKKFESKILRYAQHKTYQGKPISQVVLDVAGTSIFVKIGARRAKAADTESQNTKTAGSSTRKAVIEPVSKIPSFKGKTLEEINKIKSDVRRGKYND